MKTEVKASSTASVLTTAEVGVATDPRLARL